MAHHNQRAGVLQEGILQYVLRVHVQVVSGLVKHQKVARRQEQLGQRQAGLLAAAEHFHLLVDIVVGEKETAQDVAYLRADVALGDIVNGLEHRLVEIEHSCLILRIVADCNTST